MRTLLALLKDFEFVVILMILFMSIQLICIAIQVDKVRDSVTAIGARR